MTMLLLMFSGRDERAPGPQTVNLKIWLSSLPFFLTSGVPLLAGFTSLETEKTQVSDYAPWQPQKSLGVGGGKKCEALQCSIVSELLWRPIKKPRASGLKVGG
jgi:hypothetical protein